MLNERGHSNHYIQQLLTLFIKSYSKVVLNSIVVVSLIIKQYDIVVLGPAQWV